MNAEAINAIASRASESVFIVKTDQESYEIRRAMQRAAAIAIRDTEYMDKQAIDFYQQRYLTTLEDGAEKQAVEKAFAAVLADFVEEQEKK